MSESPPGPFGLTHSLRCFSKAGTSGSSVKVWTRPRFASDRCLDGTSALSGVVPLLLTEPDCPSGDFFWLCFSSTELLVGETCETAVVCRLSQ